MGKAKKVILIILTILVIIVMFITGIIVFNLKKNKENYEEDNYYHSEEELEIGEKENRKIIEVNNRNRYYTVKNILNTYITYIQQINGIIGFQKYEGDEEVIQEGIDQLYSILDDEYIDKMNINKEKIKNIYKNYSNYDLRLEKMYSYEVSERTTIYLVYANINNEEVKMLIKTDAVNMAFSIYLDDYINANAYSEEMDVNNIKINDNQIEKNSYNVYRYINISDEYMVKQYMDSFKSEIINRTEYTYNNLLESDYKEKRFGSIDKFKEYVNNNKENIENIEISKYQIEDYEDYKEYICIDQYENYYIFKEKAIMNYTFVIDTYTIPTDKFKETYNSVSDERKVQMNIDKFFQMINRHDYKTAYNCLAESFKNNYFKTEQDFENYAKNKFFEYNSIEFKGGSETGNNTYICKIQLSDITGQNTDKKDINIIMRIGNDLEFEIALEM